jgi:hypothetical protein
MSVTGADSASDSARLPIELRNEAVGRNAASPRKSLNSLPYLISVSLIATWVVGVFFGVGFLFLVSGLGVGGPDLTVSLAESSGVLEEAPSLLEHEEPGNPLEDSAARMQSTRPNQLTDTGSQKGTGDRDQAFVTPSKQNAMEMGQQAASAAFATAPLAEGELTAVPLLRNPSSGATVPRGVAQPAHSTSTREQHHRRPANTRTTAPHPPVQAIQDVMQKHSKLFK